MWSTSSQGVRYEPMRWSAGSWASSSSATSQVLQWAFQNPTVGISKSYSGHFSFPNIISKSTKMTHRSSDRPMITKVNGSAALTLVTSRCAQELVHVIAGGDMQTDAVISRSHMLDRARQPVGTVGTWEFYSGHFSFLNINSKLTKMTYRLSDRHIVSKVNGIAVDQNFEPENDTGSQIG